MVQELAAELKAEGNEELVRIEEGIASADKALLPEAFLYGESDSVGREEIRSTLPVELGDHVQVGVDRYEQLRRRKLGVPPGCCIAIDSDAFIESLRDRDVIARIKMFSLSGRERGGDFLTSTICRFQALNVLEEARPEGPENPVRSRSRSLEFAEKWGEKALEIMQVSNPREANAFEMFSGRELTLDDFWDYLEGTLMQAQVAPSILRDEWILAAVDNFIAVGGELRRRDLRALQDYAYLPDTKEELGMQIWEKIKQRSFVYNPDQSRSSLIDYIEEILPAPSLKRNQVLIDLVEEGLIGSYGYSEARKLAALTWHPGLPYSKPLGEYRNVSAFSDFMESVLDGFEDDEMIEIILFVSGVMQTKEWPVRYFERLCGGNLNEIQQHGMALDASARRIFLGRIFDGPQGLFARNSRIAMRVLSRHLARLIGESLGHADADFVKAVNDLAFGIFCENAFPAHTRTEILSVMMDWASERRENPIVSDERTAEMIIALFDAAGSAGRRNLQGLVMEADVFSPGVRQYIRKVQYQAPMGSPVLPFHLMQAQGQNDVSLGRRRGGGSMADIHELVSVGGVRVDDILVKTQRPDTVGLVRVLNRPMEAMAERAQGHGFAMSKAMVQRVSASVELEGRSLTKEALRTGMPVAKVLQAALQGGQIEAVKEGVLAFDFPVGEGKDSLPMLLPATLQELGGKAMACEGEYQFFFAMGDVGHGAETIAGSEILSKRGGRTLAEYLENERGIKQSVLCDCMANVFYKALLEGSQPYLFRDLQTGNFGTLTCPDTGTAALFLLDFGSDYEEFPVYWRNSIMRLAANISLHNFDEVRRDFIEYGIIGREPQLLNKEDLSRLDHFLQQVSDRAKHYQGSHSEQIISDISELARFLHDDWPLPHAIGEFCEALRRVDRGIHPYMSSDQMKDMMMSLGQKFLLSKMGASDEFDRSEDNEQQINEFLEGLE